MANTRTKQTVNANNFLYEFLQHQLRQQDEDLYRHIVRDMVVKLGIWFPQSTYQQLPILLPHVVRDATARQNRKLNRKERWGSPNDTGYLRDDNSLVKGLVRSLEIHSPTFRPYMNRYPGSGFWAAHVWNRTNNGGRATETARTNSFLPNLVWLPASVAKLTDVQGDYAQLLVQAISSSLYRHTELRADLLQFTDESWNMLPPEASDLDDELPRLEELNYFKVTPKFIETRLVRIETALVLLRWVKNGRASDRPSTPGKILPRRYVEGLETMDSFDVEELCDYLERYSLAVRSARS